jgi:outer membrane protein assembly factor BamA
MEGIRYTLASLRLEGNPKSASAEVNNILVTVHTPQDYNFALLEEKRQRISDALGHHGYALARVQLEQTPNDEDRTIHAVYKIKAGSPILIGRIDFKGNKRIPDKFLRRELRFQLPVIQQPARFIFSWNLLRLNTFFQKPTSILQLVEPQTSFRFALGAFYQAGD